MQLYEIKLDMKQNKKIKLTVSNIIRLYSQYIHSLMQVGITLQKCDIYVYIWFANCMTW